MRRPCLTGVRRVDFRKKRARIHRGEILLTITGQIHRRIFEKKRGGDGDEYKEDVTLNECCTRRFSSELFLFTDIVITETDQFHLYFKF